MLLGLSIGGPWGLGGHVPPPQFYWLNFGGARDPPPKKKIGSRTAYGFILYIT